MWNTSEDWKCSFYGKMHHLREKHLEHLDTEDKRTTQAGLSQARNFTGVCDFVGEKLQKCGRRSIFDPENQRDENTKKKTSSTWICDNRTVCKYFTSYWIYLTPLHQRCAVFWFLVLDLDFSGSGLVLVKPPLLVFDMVLGFAKNNPDPIPKPKHFTSLLYTCIRYRMCCINNLRPLFNTWRLLHNDIPFYQ